LPKAEATCGNHCCGLYPFQKRADDDGRRYFLVVADSPLLGDAGRRAPTTGRRTTVIILLKMPMNGLSGNNIRRKAIL
jgi:hypothetical protein